MPCDLASLLDRIREDQPPGAAAAGQHHRDEPHDASADDEHRRATRHPKRLEARQTTGGGLGHRRGDRIEPARQGVDIARGQRDALGKAADAHALRTLAHATGLTLRALAAAVGRLAADQAPDEAPAHPTAHRADDAGVLVAEHERRLPGKKPLRRMHVGATDAGGVDGDHDLARPGDGLGRVVEGESALALPGRDSHVGKSPFVLR